MTTPIAHGYPDWGRYMAQTDVVLFNTNAESVNPSVDHGPFFCVGFKYVAMTMSPDTDSFQYQLIWANDSGGSTTLAIDGAVMPQASSNTLVFPVLGPWLTVRATPRTPPGSHGLVVFTVPTATSLVGANADATTFTSGGVISIGGGATTNFDFTSVFTGELSVWTYTNAAAGAIGFQVADLAGAFTLVANGSNPAAGTPKQLNFTMFLPPRPLRVQCFNGDGVARDFAFGMVGRPFHGGR